MAHLFNVYLAELLTKKEGDIYKKIGQRRKRKTKTTPT